MENIRADSLKLTSNLVINATMVYDDNEKYEGQFKNSLRDGKGTYYYSDGN